MKESDIQRGIMAAFRAAGWKVWRLQAGTARGGRTHMAEAGAPDLVCLSPFNHTVFVEVKTSTGKLSKEQSELEKWLMDRGYWYTVMRRVEDVGEVL